MSQSQTMQTSICFTSLLWKWATSSKGHRASGLWWVDIDPPCLSSMLKDGCWKITAITHCARRYNVGLVSLALPTSCLSQLVLSFWLSFAIYYNYWSWGRKILSHSVKSLKFTVCINMQLCLPTNKIVWWGIISVKIRTLTTYQPLKVCDVGQCPGSYHPIYSNTDEAW